ncbi:hypothetical protein SAMN04489810_1293 [Microbacterium pygmaeum]|uniref:DUF6993 domain-containing protein n=1 Tax=Microbacterium pygmaeum TaxID=370764 RepID=A0A1G7X3U0_9MICO|nr:hypothetical protein SAMN04489810_1293 [Microbacterium pygmaeum]
MLGGALAVAGCAEPAEPNPSEVPTRIEAATPGIETASPAPESAGPVLVPDGSADDNLPLFSSVVASVWSGPEPYAGRAYIDALSVAGFDRGAMQVTEDESTVGNPAESIQFSVRWDEECLVGQVGQPGWGEPVAVVVPGILDGGCLVGNTRPIDW